MSPDQEKQRIHAEYRRDFREANDIPDLRPRSAAEKKRRAEREKAGG